MQSKGGLKKNRRGTSSHAAQRDRLSVGTTGKKHIDPTCLARCAWQYLRPTAVTNRESTIDMQSWVKQGQSVSGPPIH